MAQATCSDEHFMQLWGEFQSPQRVADHLGIGVRRVMERRNRLEKKYSIQLDTADSCHDRKMLVKKYQGRIDVEIQDGVVIIGSDAHYWPGFVTTAHRAFVMLCKQLKPRVVVMNGDAFDGATISRFPRPFFDEGKPSVLQELTAVEERLTEIEKAAGNADLIWTLGNHDLRYEHRLASNVPEYQGVKGFHLKDKFPLWKPAWSVWFNDEIEVRHRIRGGIHATWNNIQANHCTTITGHLHALQVKPYTDGRGIVKYGVDTGTLADIDGPQFTDYLEGRTPAWRSGFVVLTFRHGELLFPELVMKHDEDSVQFRGYVLHADTGAIL